MMEAFLLWLAQTVGALAVCYGITAGISAIRLRWNEWRIRRDKLNAKMDEAIQAVLDTELDKLRAENFNYRVAEKIRKKLRERGKGLGS